MAFKKFADRPTRTDHTIFLVISNLSLGGAQKQVLYLHDFLKTRGFKVVIVLSDVWGLKGLHYETGIRDLVFSRRLGILNPFLLALEAIFIIVGFFRKRSSWSSRRSRPEEAQFRENRALRWLARFAFLSDYPGSFASVVGLRKLLASSPNAWFISFLPRANVVSLLALSRRTSRVIPLERNDYCRQELRESLVVLRAALYNQLACIGANSQHCLEDLREVFPEANCIWVPNLDEDLVQSSAGERALVMFVGRLSTIKRPEGVIRAFHQSQLPRRKLKLFMAGDGPERENVDRLVSQLKLEKSVIIGGAVPSGQLPFSEGLVVALNSLHEGYPNICDEALAAGCLPVFFEEIEELNCLFGDPLSGYLSFGSEAELAELMERLCCDSEYRLRLLELAQGRLAIYKAHRGSALEAFVRQLETATLT